MNNVFQLKFNNAVLLIYLTILFSGIFRKWILPELSSVLYFVGDGIVLYCYYLAYKYNQFPKDRWAILYYSFFIGFFLLAGIQILIYSQVISILFGWRNYCLMLPLVVLMRTHLTELNLIRIAKWSCWVAIPSAIVVYMQYTSGPTDFINRTAGLEAKKVFIVVKDVVRPSGFFSFTLGESYYTLVIFMSLLYNYFLPKQKRFLNSISFILVGSAAFVHLALSGSRTTYGFVFLLLFSMFIGNMMLIKYKKAWYSSVVLLFLVIISALLFPILFPKSMGEMSVRLETSSRSEGGIVNRVLDPIVVALTPLKYNLPLLGKGLGAETPGANAAKNAYEIVMPEQNQNWYYESEWLRFIAEAGIVFGFAYFLLRIFSSIFLLLDSFKAMFHIKSPIPLFFAGPFVYVVFIGTMTFNGLSYAFGWYFLGVCLAVNTVYKNKLDLNA